MRVTVLLVGIDIAVQTTADFHRSASVIHSLYAMGRLHVVSYSLWWSPSFCGAFLFVSVGDTYSSSKRRFMRRNLSVIETASSWLDLGELLLKMGEDKVW